MNEIIEAAEAKVAAQFKRVDKIKEYNQEKVLNAFQKYKIGLEHFASVSGYGHDDMGREALDNVFAEVFKTEAAVVRNHFVSGTHAIACALFGNLRYGEKLVSVVGTPYDTMEEVIGTRGNKRASLMGHGVLYEEIPLKDETYVDFELLEKKIDKSVNMVTIQRSRGYSLRKSLDIATTKKVIDIVKSKNPDCICFIDNCYCEFVEEQEPLEIGADLIAGSLIKNPGGGIVEAGGYIAGKKEYVEQAAMRLTAPGIGAEGGAMLNQLRLIYQGLFMAPSIVAEAVKGSILASQVFEDIGFVSTPKPEEPRCDLIQTIKFGAPGPLMAFCKALQYYSPVESYLTPIPDEVPGYDDKLIMAGGSFIEGSTIELSADGPMRPPYAAYMQGGLNYAHVKIALNGILKELGI
ncbi:TPA: methionine gamma-lyase family protein [Candidatus Spyradomonas excrementavium]|nr:methionine gamma-lyase family protein [Candidatus Spyradomonas excrementavium]